MNVKITYYDDAGEEISYYYEEFASSWELVYLCSKQFGPCRSNSITNITSLPTTLSM